MNCLIAKIKVRYQLIFCLVFTAVTSCNSGGDYSEAQDNINVPEESLVLNKSKGIFLLQQKPFSGTSVKKYNNLQTARSIEYIKGKKQGLMQLWFENGQISYQANYKKGRLDGPIKSWWKNGKLRSKSNYADGKVHGNQKQWYPSGAKFKELNFKNGLEEGMQMAWRENGKLYNNYEAKNGRIFGLKRSSLCYTIEDETIKYSK